MRTRVFVSYCHDDIKWLEAIRGQLRVLEAEGLIDIYEDTKLEAGEAWYERLHQEMQSAKIALLLVSASFLTSRFIRNEEVPRLFEKHAAGGMVLYPLLVRPCPFEHVPWLARLQLRPQDSRRRPKAVSATTGAAREQVLVNVAKEIATTVVMTKKAPALEANGSRDTLFSGWVRYSSIGRVYDVTEDVNCDDGGIAIRITARRREHAGLSKAINALVGTVSFSYRVESHFVSPNIFFYVIPVQEAITGAEGIVEVGSSQQDDVRNQFSPFRARFSPAPHEYDDGDWHSATIAYDFRYLRVAFYAIFALRVNEGATEPGPGKVCLRDVVFSNTS